MAPPKLTLSFKRLRKSLNRGDTLLDKFFDRPGGKVRSVGKPKAHEQELLRAVLVLTIGSLDAFLSELLVELLPGMARVSPEAAVFDRVAKENPGLVLRAMYLGGIEEALSEAIEAHFQAKTMHGARPSDRSRTGARLDSATRHTTPQGSRLRYRPSTGGLKSDTGSSTRASWSR